MLAIVSTAAKQFYEVHSTKINASLMAFPVAVSAMVMPVGAEGFDVTTTADTVISLMVKGVTFISDNPVLSLSFVAGLMGTVIFGNIKKAKRAVK